MKDKFVFLIGILGVCLFAVSSILGGWLIEDYSIWSQYISETYAIDTEYGLFLRTFGIIPSGILLTIFCFLGFRIFKAYKLSAIGFIGIGIFYGLATIIVGIFPCDEGCNRDFINPSFSQIIHNVMGLLTYVFVPISMILVGLGLKKSANYLLFSRRSILYGVLSMSLIFLFFSDSNSAYIGLYQRLVELVFILWIITCALTIKNRDSI